jgi:hypothetical protein
LPVIGRLLGHAQAATTSRYAHLDSDPLRRASEAIAGKIAAALDGNQKATVLPLHSLEKSRLSALPLEADIDGRKQNVR